MTRALTAFLIVGMTAMAPGAILWFPRQDIPIPTTFEGVSVDLETGNSSITAAGLPGGAVNFLLGGAQSPMMRTRPRLCQAGNRCALEPLTWTP